MRRTKAICHIAAILALAASCIKPFDPDIDPADENKYVIHGCITDQEGYQIIDISLTSPVDHPEHVAVSGCNVKVSDNRGYDYLFLEEIPGKYSCWMDKTSLMPGVSFKLTVSTPTGDILESDYDTIPEPVPLDSVYYLLEDHPTSDPAIFDRGLQFYVNVNAEGYNSRHFRWQLVETWEYHAAHAKEYYYDGSFHAVDPPDSSTFICWSTASVKDIFTLSTKNLYQNKYQGYPLQFVNGQTSKLSVLYSFMIRQLVLSETAYAYWEKLRVNSNEQGGLYEKQPLDINGNIKVVSGSAKEVLGCFYTASVNSRRLFISPIVGLEMNYFNFCNEEPLGHFGWDEFLPKDYPVWYYLPVNVGLRILNNECVECEMMGGVTQKPDFWPE